ncbi:MAG: transcriptional regulator [Gemmatimonadales bacterium]
MRPESDVRRVFELSDQGLSRLAIARDTGVSHTQVRRWLGQELDAVLSSPMRRDAPACDGTTCELISNVDEPAYAYLLGMYLGDGWITRGRRGVFRLGIAVCDAYPGIRVECETAIRAVMPGRAVGAVRRIGCHDLSCYSKHWPCLFPQHGPGRKHERRIMLEQWQRGIAYDRYPDLFLRGLIHSDGCRAMNTVTSQLLSGRKQYTYPRYFFKNESADIRGFFIEACSRLSVECRYSQPNTISVARRASVAKLDSFIGPKT